MRQEWEKYKLPLAIIVLAIIFVVAIAMTSFRKGVLPPLPSQSPLAPLGTPAPEGLGSELYEGATQPTENLPQTNPFDAKTNPYDTYQNPFE